MSPSSPRSACCFCTFRRGKVVRSCYWCVGCGVLAGGSGLAAWEREPECTAPYNLREKASVTRERVATGGGGKEPCQGRRCFCIALEPSRVSHVPCGCGTLSLVSASREVLGCKDSAVAQICPDLLECTFISSSVSGKERTAAHYQ